MEEMIYNTDCIDFMRDCPIHEFDLILTDPPYDNDYDAKIEQLANLRKGRDYSEGGTQKAYHEFDENVDYDLMARLFYKVLKPNSYCIIFSGDEQSAKWKTALRTRGFKFHQHLIWVKNNATKPLSPYRTFIKHELVNIFSKESPMKLPAFWKGKGSLLKYKTVGRERDHPCEKPVMLLMHLIELYSREKDKVYDPFAGSGSALEACLRLGRIPVGNELLINYYNKIKMRIKKVNEIKSLTQF